MKRILDDYFYHFKLNKYSLIAKIYGIFTFKTKEHGTYKIIMMKNIAGCDKEYILN